MSSPSLITRRGVIDTTERCFREMPRLVIIFRLSLEKNDNHIYIYFPAYNTLLQPDKIGLTDLIARQQRKIAAHRRISLFQKRQRRGYRGIISRDTGRVRYAIA